MEGGRNPQIRRGQILHILKYKSWVGGQRGEGDGGRLPIYDKSEMNLKITMLLRLIFLAQMLNYRARPEAQIWVSFT